MNEEIIKYLLGRVIELEAEVKRLEKVTSSSTITVQSGQPIGNIAYPYQNPFVAHTCIHEYEQGNGGLGSLFMKCKKCGQPQTMITYAKTN